MYQLAETFIKSELQMRNRRRLLIILLQRYHFETIKVHFSLHKQYYMHKELLKHLAECSFFFLF